MSDDVSFGRREFKGSRLRCLMATSLADREVAAFLNQLVQPHARVSDKDTWQPRGLLEGDEARLGEAATFLTADQGEAVTAWWLTVRERANTPNWDIVSAYVALEPRSCPIGHLQRRQTKMSQIHRVTVDPNVCGGRPTVRGLRIRVKDVLDLLAAGADRAEILADYPYLEDDDITAVLEFAARQSDHPVLRSA